MTEVSPELQDALQRMFDSAFGREPRWRYFQRDGGPMFFWSTERYDDDSPHHAGHYVSGVYEPYGPGSRSGKSDRWRLVEDSLSGAALRKDAKARALRLFRAWEAGNSKPWR